MYFLASLLHPVQLFLHTDKNKSGLLVYLLMKEENKSSIQKSEEVKLLKFSKKVRFKGGSSNFIE